MDSPKYPFPAFVFFICPDCHGSGKARADMYGDIHNCHTCEGKGKVSFSDAVEKIIRENGWEYDTHKKAEKIIKPLVPMDSIYMGVEVVLSNYWYHRLIEFLKKDKS